MLNAFGRDTWQVKGSQKSCSSCGSQFEENQTFYSALSEEEGQFRRDDFCPACWERARGEGFFCFWKTRHQPPQAEVKVETDVLMDLFWRLQDPQTPKDKAFRFVLALYLCRRRALKLAGNRHRNGSETLLLRSGGQEELIPVENPQLDEAQIEQVTTQLKELLQMDL